MTILSGFMSLLISSTFLSVHLCSKAWRVRVTPQQSTFVLLLLQMSTFHYSNLRIKFEGEEGSGPGVNRGFFAAMANALKTDEKVGLRIT